MGKEGQGQVKGKDRLRARTGQGQGQDTGTTGKGLRRAGMVNSWMPTCLGKSWARMPG